MTCVACAWHVHVARGMWRVHGVRLCIRNVHMHKHMAHAHARAHACHMLHMPWLCSPWKAGIIGSFPALNARPKESLDEWLTKIKSDLAEHSAAHPDRPAAACVDIHVEP